MRWRRANTTVYRRPWEREDVRGLFCANCIEFFFFTMTYLGTFSLVLLCVVLVKSDMEEDEKGKFCIVWRDM